jgi:hypothetical protein
MPNQNAEINPTSNTFALVGQGAYVDLGYGGVRPFPKYPPGFPAITSWFFNLGWPKDRAGNPLATAYSVYDTWSFHYENNGVDEDRDSIVDEGTNGFDDVSVYADLGTGNPVTETRNGIDDIGERETAPPYDRPLRGVQVKLRVFERDSQQIREVSVNQHFVPE